MDVNELLEPFNGLLVIYWLYLVTAFIWSFISLINSLEYRIATAFGQSPNMKLGILYHGIWLIPLILTYRIGGT